MDNIRDNKDNKSLTNIVNNESITVDPFGANRMGSRAYERAERIVAALHMITNHVPKDEPVRNLIRQSALDLLEQVLSLRSNMRSVFSEKDSLLKATVRKLISQVRIAVISGYISPQNSETLVEALDEFANFVDSSEKSILSEHVLLNKDDLKGIQWTGRPLKDIKDKINLKDSDVLDGKIEVNVLNKTERPSVRRDGVLSVLSISREIGIRDIVAHLPEYSEKMIQRELAALVAEGKVKKNGLKRWSTYILSSIDNPLRPGPQTEDSVNR